MADYLPLYKPGEAITRTTSGAVTAGQLVSVSGSGTVATSGAGDADWLGVAGFTAASGATVTVHSGGVQRLVAGSGGVTAGDVLIAGAAGTVVTLAAVTTPTPTDVTNTRAVVGIALTTAIATALVEVKMER